MAKAKRQSLDDENPVTSIKSEISVSELQHAIEPIVIASERKSVNPDYRLLQINPDDMVIVGQGAAVRVMFSLGLSESFCVDAASFCAVANFLDKSQHITFTLENSVLIWSSKHAKGKIATAAAVDLYTNFEAASSSFDSIGAMRTCPQLTNLISLGSLSSNNGMLVNGAFAGFAVYPKQPDGFTYCASSDNKTIALAYEKIDVPIKKPVYFSSTSVKLLVMLSKRDGFFHFGDRAVTFISDDERTEVIVNQIDALRYDILVAAKKFVIQSPVHRVKLERQSINLYTKRVAELSERFNHAEVTLVVKNGGISLQFSEGVTENEEYFVVDQLDVTADMKVRLSASNISLALKQCSMLVADFMDKDVLIFEDDDARNFTYIIAGKSA